MKPDATSIGKIYHYSFMANDRRNKILVDVKVIKSKLSKSFGNLYLLVEPVKGKGQMWVSPNSLIKIK